jgi:thiamine-phosphate pyrophosphorylase
VTTLDRLLVLTDVSQTRGRPLRHVVAAALRGGACGVILRENTLPPDERAELAAALREVVRDAGGTFLVAGGLADRAVADGMHLAAGDPLPPSPPPFVGRSCHDRDALRRAAAEGCSYATLSPIFATASKPGYGPPLDVDALGDPPLPVFALGGVDPSRAARCVAAGAHGVAVMGAVMRADDPAKVVAGLLDALRAGASR